MVYSVIPSHSPALRQWKITEGPSQMRCSADVVLLKAADMLADERARLMGEVQADAQVIPYRP
jgi:hypothetical protein